MSEWNVFDRQRYSDTGPHHSSGVRYDGPVEVKLSDGSVKQANFYTRLIGGFERSVGNVTHWRFISAPP